MANTKIPSELIADNSVGIAALNVSDGSNGQVLTTDGSGSLSFSTVSGTTINNNADNKVITGSGTANTLEAESSLVFDGTNLGLGTASANTQLHIYKASTNAHHDHIKLEMAGGWSGSQDKFKSIVWNDGTNNVGGIGMTYDGTTTNMHFHSMYNGGYKAETDEVFSILGSGKCGINDSSPSQALEVSDSSNYKGIHIRGSVAPCLTFAQGTSSTPTWRVGISGYDGAAFAIATGASVGDRLQIKSDGKVLIRTTSTTTDAGQLQLTSADDLYSMYVNNTGFASIGSMKAVERGATSAYSFAQWYSGRRPDTGGGDREFNFRGDGNAYADGSFNNSGADYAEYFESHTGSAIPRGTSVVLENNKVRAATSEDNVADIIGVVRPKEFGKNSMVVGNTAWNMWSEKYLTDDFNCYVMEDYSVVSWNDEDGELVTYESDNIPSDVTVPDDAETNTHDANGVKFQRRALNPDFDASRAYEPREDRDEWVIVGLIGQVQILDGQPTNDRWIKMRDISDTVEEWYIR